MTEATNVIAFARPRPEPAAFDHVEVRLAPNFNVTFTAIDAAGDVTVFEFALIAPAKAADLERLRDAWERWRGGSQAAS